jgi:hypothetical protein
MGSRWQHVGCWGRRGHAPISASWSFSPAASCSSCEILAANNFEVSVGSATFFPFDFFDIAAEDIAGCAFPGDGPGRTEFGCPLAMST